MDQNKTVSCDPCETGQYEEDLERAVRVLEFLAEQEGGLMKSFERLSERAEEYEDSEPASAIIAETDLDSEARETDSNSVAEEKTIQTKLDTKTQFLKADEPTERKKHERNLSQ
jgi:hypothetical protein